MVDAGMRQLYETGWMHNRVRMVVASFLVKHLLISWNEGAKWFWDTLVDADLASNTQGWQWAAQNCGADAAPYFRIFNPILQGKSLMLRGITSANGYHLSMMSPRNGFSAHGMLPKQLLKIQISASAKITPSRALSTNLRAPCARSTFHHLDLEESRDQIRTTNVRRLVVVLGDQLDYQRYCPNDFNPHQDMFWMAEQPKSPLVLSNKHRIVFFLSSMRHFRIILEYKICHSSIMN